MSVGRKLVPFVLIMAVELGILETWRKTRVTMQQRSFLRVGLYGHSLSGSSVFI